MVPGIQILVLGEEFELRLIVYGKARSIGAPRPGEGWQGQKGNGVIQRLRASSKVLVVAGAQAEWRGKLKPTRPLRPHYDHRIKRQDDARQDQQRLPHVLALPTLAAEANLG